jgi:hypothetical protein
VTQQDLFTQSARDSELERLREQNARLEGELARAAHWQEPPRKHRILPPPKPLDYRAWLDHTAECLTCSRAHEDIAELRRGTLESEPVVACPAGLRLIPLEMPTLLVPGIDRGEAHVMLLRLIDHARREQERSPDGHIGVAWSGAPVSMGGDE